MNKLPKITIVTPSFNQAQFLEKTIQSVISQDYTNIQYIVMDGGSNDKSVEIIRKYENKIDYWESKKDHGQSHAINKGFRKAKGDIIGWLNSDDFLTVGALSKLVENIDDESVLYYGILGESYENGKHLRLEPFDEYMTFERLLHAKSPCLQPGSFYKREIVERIGYLDESLDFVMDWDLWLRLLQEGQSKFIPYIMAYIRRHDRSKSNNKRLSNIHESKHVFRKYGGSLFSLKYFKSYLLVCLMNYFLKRYK